MESEESKKRTLAGASEAGLGKYLDRRNTKNKKPIKQTKAAKNLLAASPLREAAENDAICGAPAQFAEVEHDLNKPAQEGRSRVEDAPAIAPFWPVRQEMEDDWEDDWGEAFDEENDASGAPPEQQQANKDLLITLGKEDTKLLQPPKRKFTKEEIRASALSHQLHLMCLLARGIMLDTAASEPLVQAMALSCVPADVDATLCKIPKPGLRMTNLVTICNWFRDNTRLQESSPDQAHPDPENFKEAGSHWMSQHLQKVATSRSGSPEELIALFVAVLRSHGFLTRFVRALDPLPWRPNLRERHIPRQQRPPVSERPSRKRKADDSAAKDKPATKAEPVTGDDSAANGKTSAGKGARSSEKADGHGSGEADEPNAGSRNPPGQGKGRGRGRGRASGRGRGRGRGRMKNSEEEAPKPGGGNLGKEDGKHQDGKGKNARSKLKKEKSPGVSAGENTAEKQQARTEEEKKSAEKESGEGKQKRQRKGDIEFENQIAMAMMASATGQEASPKNPDLGTDNAATEVETKEHKIARRRGLLKTLTDKESGSVWAKNANQNQVGDALAEVYCDAEDDGKGRWVHVQPLLSWLDRPELVENASLRFEPLTYVVAFSGGGAKDISSRYVSNTQELEKRIVPPQKKWWKETMTPLRQAELASTRAHLSAHHSEVVDLAPERYPSAEPQAMHGASSLGAGPLEDGKGSRNDLKAEQEGSLQGVPASTAGKEKKQGLKHKKAKDEVAARASREDEELKSITKKHQQIIPTTLDGFKHHKLYILQRHISRYCTLRPSAKVLGIYKGEPYYQRSDVSELHTAEKWITHGREVLPSQIMEPAKTVAKRGSKAKQNLELQRDAGDFGEDEENDGRHPVAQDEDANTTKLYGEWQTKAWTPPMAFDGIVPKNERGNVHCPPLAPCLPIGTRQVARPRVVGVCKRLDVDYAMAMTGFDIRGGRSIPRFEGVVVCEEVAELVEQEWEKEQRELEEKKAEKRIAEASQTWFQLLRAMFMRLGLQEGKSEAKPKAKPRKQSKNSKTSHTDAAAEEEAGQSAVKRKRGQKSQEKPAKAAQDEDFDHARSAAEIEEI